MTDPLHDWFSHLNPMEKSRIRIEEKNIDAKTKHLSSLPRKGYGKTKDRLKLEIAGHRFFKEQLINRGIQRARLGISVKRRIGSRRRTAA